MRSIGVVTVARSDYGIYLPILRQIKCDSELDLHLLVAGMHLSPEFGMTVDQITADGFAIADRIEMSLSSDTPEGVAKSIGLGVIGFSQSFARTRPDILMVLGDRFEMQSSVIAALPFALPVAHIHGGEATEGLIDEPIRHSITKMSHLHYVSTDTYRDRVLQMGEEEWRVVISGAPSLDNLSSLKLLGVEKLEEMIGCGMQPAPILVTMHPVTLEYEDTPYHIRELIAALEHFDRPVLFTYPNADTYGRVIVRAIEEYVRSHKKAKAVKNLGTETYFSLMKHAALMVGNSSSGIIEAASMGLPVVNIGNRQRGRVRGKNVIDTGYDRDAIKRGMRRALSEDFKSEITGAGNPYGDGKAAERIVKSLKQVVLDSRLIVKRFVDRSC